MTRTMTSTLWLGLALTFTVSHAPPAAAAVNAGTLTCTLSPSLVEPTGPSKASVSCSFKPLIGTNARFEGVIERFGVTEQRGAQIVLVWSVLAPGAEVAIDHLEGKYYGTVATPADGSAPGSTGSAEPALVGGHDKSIQLRPLTPEPSVAPGSGVSILEIKVAKIRT